ncbi:divalent-cation tolerance protein CutA [Gimibacter soli]|uniref:Divalent-cation tolerance protein CutA n=1 Tax=Gimibacter soli TaxID=3024400 RepID=A0AAE9XKY8_9PROT|nr:divalent-cation tolerance protein CutA [Gimibacter soli]WCL52827.1 divalent-cation tolerance protein CutA [Gimibacter soli]
MQDEDIVQIYMTTDSEDVAIHIATTLVNERLIACANLTSGTRSIYRWDGAIRLDREITIIMKTVKSSAEAAVARANELHTYEVPCIVTLDVTGGHAEYLKWVREQTVPVAVGS